MNTVTKGALAGAVGGMAMAMWSMIVLWLNGTGFWTPLNLIAHTFWRDAPLDSRYCFQAAVAGLVVHMLMSMMVGVAFALAVQRVRGSAASLAFFGMGLALLLWAVMQGLVWRTVDAPAAMVFTPWVFATGHAMYGGITGYVVAALRTAGARGTAGYAPTR
ncbi:hypothetical protein [[Mycobacterium] nativiensis]|uniref:DUF4383 domain-containing protein n=1 Tax=[Mycobacterium] nativiensis TaxID=2855503 RepID=A0ABU5XZL6_9MYCO|nr:hypothetical protein [Mycolicibacter sp. MYC340]MEB3033385.1 hypothetical protein [Mycolicibacter sp. MYC340]